ncbi:hypothetical protein ABZP36_035244 [Zizania latifolia]
MAENPQLFGNGMPVPFYGEMFVLARDGVEFQVDKIPSYALLPLLLSILCIPVSPCRFHRGEANRRTGFAIERGIVMSGWGIWGFG